MHVVWFKRDLRVEDHLPLLRAAKAGRCLCLYVYEPELIRSDEYDASHLQFLNESLQDLDRELRKRGGELTFRMGNVVDVLAKLHHDFGIEGLWSHEETGNRLTFDRDLAVARWVRQAGIPWREIPQSAVVRRLQSRDGWSRMREGFMDRPVPAPPAEIVPVTGIETDKIQTHSDFGLPRSEKTELQSGGQASGKQLLESFLKSRGERYQQELSSPVTAWDSCSRLSTYLAWGCLSIRQVTQAVKDRRVEVQAAKAFGKATGTWLGSLRAFESRLSWRCHFIQKLEDEPSLEFENMSRSYDGLREECFNQFYFDAWAHGQTGYPLVDACMRALRQHSWINFRMRAMLTSFASYHLWLHWRPTALHLAKHFLDFEPGIHFPQVQMQSGTTGINAIRIYSPTKQACDQDPQGIFIRRYVPELEGVPDEHIAEPHRMSLSQQSKFGCRVGDNYPKPIVEHTTAYREAQRKMLEIRSEKDVRQNAKRVFQKHGSRNGQGRRSRGRSFPRR